MLKFNDNDLPAEDGRTTYQLSLEGWQGDTDETDDLVKWVNAPSRGSLEAFVARQGWRPDASGVDSIGPFGIEDGVDYVIDGAGEIVADRRSAQGRDG